MEPEIKMKITINGQLKEFDKSLSLQTLIDKYCESNKRVVAEVNGIVVQSLSWGNTTLKDGDEIEIVSLVGGG